MSLKRKFLVGTIVGGAVGSIVGILMAPKSGQATRADLAKKGTALKRAVVTQSGNGKQRSILRGILRVLSGKKKIVQPPR